MIVKNGQLMAGMILFIIALSTLGCNTKYGEHKVNAPLVSRHRGFAIIRYFDNSSENARFGFIWTNSYVSGITAAEAVGISKNSDETYIRECVLAKWLPREMLGASFYAYSQPPIQPTDDTCVTPVMSLKIMNNSIIGMLSVKKYKFTGESANIIISDVGNIEFSPQHLPSVVPCTVRITNENAPAPFNMIMKIEQPIDVNQYSYLLLPCQQQSNISIKLVSKAMTAEIHNNYNYYYCVPLNIIADTSSLNTRQKMENLPIDK